MALKKVITGDGFSQSSARLSASTVLGPASSTDNAIAVWNGTTGKLLKDSPLTTIDISTGVITGAAFSGNGFRIAGTTILGGTGIRFFTTGMNVAMANDSQVAWSSGTDGITGLDTGLKRGGVGVITFTDGSTGVGYPKTTPVLVSALPSAATVGAGTRGFVSDGSTTLILGLGLTVVGGGSNKVPVYSDGTNWIVG